MFSTGGWNLRHDPREGDRGRLPRYSKQSNGFRSTIALFFTIDLACRVLSAAPPEGIEFFEKKIRPIFSDHCYSCHSASAEKIKGGLLLDTQAALLKGGNTGPSIVAGDPERSLLIKAVRYTDDDLQMPPKGKKLSASQIADLVEWVKLGAPYPADTGASHSNAIPQGKTHWSFQPLKDSPPPSVKNKRWPRGPIDQFILARLEAQDLSPAPPADKATLIRRVTYDLTGLPPTPAEVNAFVADKSPEAFERVVDRLLASPLYGEHWARHWLDVVRYTDSFDARGIGGAADVPEAYRYRDWVVQAFNDDMPYDQFVENQIAGDLLPSPVSGEFNTNGLIATGVYVIGEWGTGDADKEKMLTDIVDDQIDLTSRAFLGLTMACARCHDHKFDPISTKDYYALAGIFFSSHILPDPGRKTDGSPVLRIPLASPALVEARKEREERIGKTKEQLDRLTAETAQSLVNRQYPRMAQYMKAAAAYQLRASDAASESMSSFCATAYPELLPDALGEWVRFVKDSPLTLLTKPVENVGGQPAVQALNVAGGRDTPSITVNTSDQKVNFSTITLQPKSIAVHPSPTAGVAVAWRSPISGHVTISGSLMDADDKCGNGITWRLEKRVGDSVVTLLNGGFPNGGASVLTKGTNPVSVDVTEGDLILLGVYPDGEYSCDTTEVSMVLVDGGSTRVWSLTKEISSGLLGAGQLNPRPDKYGNKNVWYFFDLLDDRASDLPVGSPGADWVAAVRAKDTNRIETAALALQNEYDRWLADTNASFAGAVLYRKLADPRSQFWGKTVGNSENLPVETKEQLAGLRKELAALQAGLAPPFPLGHGLQEGGTPKSAYEGFADTKVLIRGRYDRPGDLVPRGFPAIIRGTNPPDIGKGSGRLALARWIASPENPMTARVMANRIWQQHFGEGLVHTPNNFGKMGEPPTHPELLDWLARKFISSGWSVKAMHREILLSATYQQGGVPAPATFKADPENRLLGHFPRRRLEAEPLRDTLLFLAGNLDLTRGGPALRELENPRRTLYLMTIRSDRSNYRMLFDAPDPVGIAERRNDSIVAPQALFLLNHPFMLTRTKSLADRALALQVKDDRDRIKWLYSTLYARPPREEEVALGLGAVAVSTGGGTNELRAKHWQSYCQALLCANEFLYVD